MATPLQDAQQRQFRDKGSLRRAILILRDLHGRYRFHHDLLNSAQSEAFIYYLDKWILEAMRAEYQHILDISPRKRKVKKDETITTSSKESTTSDRVRRT
jgi:hypothetical protein